MESDKVKHKPPGDESLAILVRNKIHGNQRCDVCSPGGLRDKLGDEVLNDEREEGNGILSKAGRQVEKGFPSRGNSLSKGL